MSYKVFRVLFDFTAEEDGELSVLADEIVRSSSTIQDPNGLESDTTPDGWILVYSAQDGSSGFVPRDYLEETSEPFPVRDTQAQHPLLDVEYASSSARGPSLQTAEMSEHLSPPPSPRESEPTSMPAHSWDRLISDHAPPVAEDHDFDRHQSETLSRLSLAALSKGTPQQTSTTKAVGFAMVPDTPEVIPETPLPTSSSSSSSVHRSVTAPLSSSRPLQPSQPAAPSSSSTAIPSSPLSRSQGLGSTMSKSSLLASAAKKVINAKRMSKIVVPPKAPALLSAVERENFDELLRRNEDYFSRVMASQVMCDEHHDDDECG